MIMPTAMSSTFPLEINSLNSAIKPFFSFLSSFFAMSDLFFLSSKKNKIKKYTEQGLSQLPICVAKTQYSLSDQASLLGRPTGFTVKINDIIPSAGAGFLVAISGDIMRMPGLPKRPAAVNMDIDEDGKIIGLF
mgnify:CR=1 FL=1